MSILDDALTAVHKAGADLDAANRARETPLKTLAPAGYYIRALETALNLALRQLGQPPLDPETHHLQGRQ